MTVFSVLAFQSETQWQKIWALCVLADRRISYSVKHVASLFYCEVYQWWRTQYLLQEEGGIILQSLF